MRELQRVTIFYSNTEVLAGCFGVRQTELIFQPNLNLHSTDDNISSFKAACPLGILHIQFRSSCSLYKRMCCNQCKQVLKPIGIVDYCRLAGRVMAQPSPDRAGCHVLSPFCHLGSRDIAMSGGYRWFSNLAWKQYILLLRNDVGAVKLQFQGKRQREIIYVLRHLQTGTTINHCLWSIHSVPATRPEAMGSNGPESYLGGVTDCRKHRQLHQKVQQEM